MELLDKYNALRQEIFDYFGYKEDWKILLFIDSRNYFWRLDESAPGSVRLADKEYELDRQWGYGTNYFAETKYLPKSVYRGKDFTMIVVDPHTDNGPFLRIFDNSKER